MCVCVSVCECKRRCTRVCECTVGVQKYFRMGVCVQVCMRECVSVCMRRSAWEWEGESMCL
jgi:hypothetical protein